MRAARVRRVMVVGCAGAGKTVLSQALGERLGLPVVHLDVHFWRPGWVEPSAEEWRAQQVELFAAADGWVADGNYGGTLDVRLPMADLVVFLDVSRWVCLRGVLGRWWRHRGRDRIDRAEGCSERIDWPFLRYVWSYRRLHRPRLLRRIEEHGAADRLVRLTTRSEAERFMLTG